MSSQAFWQSCIDAGVVIVPFIAYSQYRDGNLAEQDKIGLRYIALDRIPKEHAVQSGDFWLYIDSAVTDTTLIADTPEKALELYLYHLVHII